MKWEIFKFPFFFYIFIYIIKQLFMVLESYKVICDECKMDIREFSYRPEEPDMLAYHMIVYKDKVFCCEECLNAYKRRKDLENSYKVTPVKLPWELMS